MMAHPDSGAAHGRRLKPLDLDGLSQHQRATYDRLVSGPRGSVRGPFEAWILLPELADRAAALGDYLRFETPLADSLVEIAALAVAKSWRASLVWAIHATLAREAGLTASTIEQLRDGREPEFDSDSEHVAFKLVTELLETRSSSQETWARANATLGQSGVVGLIGVAGYYAMVCMTVTAFEIGDLDDTVAEVGNA
jgi:4-carboxymuconolactone decarboxylase